MAVSSIEVKEYKTKHSELYRELEYINEFPRIKSKADNRRESCQRIVNRMSMVFDRRAFYGTQAEAFQAAIKLTIISGQFVGLLPVVGVLEKDATSVRFKKRSIRFAFCSIMCLVQTITLILSLFRILRNPDTVSKLGYFSLYSSTFLTSIVFFRLASKWERLMKQIYSADLNEYIDPYVKWKCNFATITLLTCGFFENSLLNISQMASVTDCYSPEDDRYQIFIKHTFSWFFETGIDYSIILGIILPRSLALNALTAHGMMLSCRDSLLTMLNLASTIMSSYSHLFVICISLFLSSVLEQINNKITSREGEYLPPSHWRKLREDYSRATQLVRHFDDAVNNIVFASFASNLLVVCLRLYHVLALAVNSSMRTVGKDCVFYPSGLFHGYEYLAYLAFSLAHVVLRSLVVALIAARVHSASLVPASSLYNVPSPSYCTEVQRFIEQLHGDPVALSGMNFFYVTKELVLTVAGTIVTYELVLLQFNA